MKFRFYYVIKDSDKDDNNNNNNNRTGVAKKKALNKIAQLHLQLQLKKNHCLYNLYYSLCLHFFFSLVTEKIISFHFSSIWGLLVEESYKSKILAIFWGIDKNLGMHVVGDRKVLYAAN